MNQPAGGDVRPRAPFPHVSEPAALQRRIDHQLPIVERDRPIHLDIDFLPVVLKLPVVKSATRKPVTHAGMLPQIAGCLRNSPALQIRMGTSEEMAKVVAFLASDDASFVSGSGVLADGGYTVA